ncbi:MAG: TonB-dependent receptor [Xanthomonadaceae bacterium]|nr:TonB-dependent receptor [Xanthomonadaceae bacterium]MDP2186148.1 TonB-dependent receptor [Xanthomonadales bacterium]MDZ4117307.1 TonB-dependent receptor [Xanthomonadaceae bacterium]
MINRNQLRLSRLTLGLMAALATAPAFAQSTSATVAGRIVNEQGAAVAGATVEIVHQPSGTTKIVTTDADGRFSTRGLRVGGPYVVKASKDGSIDATKTNVFTTLSDATPVELTLNADATRLESVAVIGSRQPSVFSPDNMGATTNITAEQISEMPSIGRTIQDYVRFDPRIVQTDKERGEISAAGQNNRFNNIRIDGVPTNDQFGLNPSGLPAVNNPISIDWIQSFNVGISDFDVTQKDFVGANINAVTKSGGNEIHGSAYGVYRSSDMVGQNFNAFDEEYTYGAYVSGPLIKDKLFFFVGYEEFERTKIAPDVGVEGSGASTIARGVTQADVDRISEIARSFGLEPGTSDSGNANNTDTKYLAKLDWNINDDHRLTLRYNQTDGQVQRLPNLSANAFSLSSNWYQDNIKFESWAALLYSNWSDNFSTEANISYSTYDSVPSFETASAPQVRVNVPSGTGVFFGTERSRQANILGVDTLTAYFAGDWVLGDHSIRFGFDYEDNDVFNLFLQDVFGNFTFNSIADFAAQRWRFFTLQQSNTGNVRDAAADFGFGNLGLFLQDTWQVNDNLTVMAGARWDKTLIQSRPQFNPAAQSAFGLTNTDTNDGQGTFQPRAGFNYTFDSELQTQIRGGVGLFQGSAPGVWVSNIFSNPGVLSTIFPGQNGVGFDADPGNLTPPAATPPASNVDFLDPSFQQPTVWKMNLAIERELPWYGLVASVEYLRNEVDEAVTFTNLNLGDATGVLPDGRESFWTRIDPTAFNSNGATGGNQSRSQRNRSFNNVILLGNTSKGSSDNLTLALEKPYSDNWSAKVAYTFGDSNEVSPATSSVAFSNWNGRAIFNPNEQINSTARSETRDRITAMATYTIPWATDVETTFGLFYEGRSGRPISYTFVGDANGDGQNGNDLFYIPNPGEVAFTAASSAADIAAFQSFIDNNSFLSSQRGSVADRSSDRDGWVNQVDLRISQSFPGGWGNKAEIFLDIQNIGNMIDKDWGHINEVAFPSSLQIARFAGVNANDQFVFDVSSFVNESTGAVSLPSKNRRDVVGESRWSAQVGFRYTF